MRRDRRGCRRRCGEFAGDVKSYDEKEKWFLVQYSDGDEEEYRADELEPLLLPLDPAVRS